MSQFSNNPQQNRIKCPVGDCESVLPESEWGFQQVTDHICPNGHIFRVEGTRIDNIFMYQINFEISKQEYFI